MKIKILSLLTGCLFALTLATGCSHADDWRTPGWKPIEQPDLVAQLQNAKPLELENVVDAPGTVRWEGPLWARNPDGKSWDAIFWYYPQYTGPTEFVIVDFGTGEVKKQVVETVPRSRQAYNFHLSSTLELDGKIYINATNYGVVSLWVYDPTTNAITHKGELSAPIGYEMRPWTQSADGFIYGAGQYAKAKRAGLYRLDPKAMATKDFGPVGPAHPNGAWVSGIALDGPWIYIASGKVPWYIVAYNTQTGEDKTLLESDRLNGLAGVASVKDGATGYMIEPKQNPFGSEYFQKDTKRIDFWIKDGKLYPRRNRQDLNAPWQTEPLAAPWKESEQKRQEYSAQRPKLFTDALAPDKDGMATLWYRSPEDAAKAPKEVPTDAKPEALGWKSLRFAVTTYPEPIRRMIELPDGRIFASVGQYQLAIFDPRDNKMQNLGAVPLSTYALVYKDGSVYLSGYPLSMVWKYDLAKPFTLNAPNPVAQVQKDDAAESNPRLLTRLSEWARTHKMWDGAVGADGKIYFGGQVVRNGDGGGLGWWDPAKKMGGGIYKPFTAHQVCWIASADKGRYIVASTVGVRDDLDAKMVSDTGMVYVFDTQTGAITQQIEPVPHQVKSGPIVEALHGLILGHAGSADGKGGVLYGIDVASGKVLFRDPVPVGPETSGAKVLRADEDFRMGPDGNVWTYFDDVLVRIEPKTLKVEVVGKISDPGRLAFSGGQVYIGSSAALRHIKGVTTP